MHYNIPELAGLICSQQANHQVPARAVGCFKLSAGRALSLTPAAPGELRIAHGRVWLTFGHAADNAAVRAGDYFFDAGDLVHLYPGQQLVMEVHHQNSDGNASDAVYFSWEPDTAPSLAASLRRAHCTQIDVQLPLRDLGSALHQAGRVLGRLAQGLAVNLACTLGRRHAPSNNVLAIVFTLQTGLRPGSAHHQHAVPL